MKWFVLPVIFLAAMGIDPRVIAKINSTKAEAKKAFLANDYVTALAKYKYLIDSLGVKEDEVLMNLAHSYFNLNDTTRAMESYQKLLTGINTNKMLRSNAYQQLGVINNRQGKLEEALSNFKEALKTDPTNEDARYDYEMVKKKLEEKKKQEEEQKKKDKNKENQDKKNEEQQQKDKQNQEKNKQDQQKKDQQQKDQQQKEQSEKEKQEKEKEKQEKEQQQKEQEEKNKQDQKDKKDNFNPDKMKEIKVTEEKAKMILEAMKNQEKQYLQQNKRKAEKPRDKGKPDW